jgi:hypothetical protein
LYGGGVLSVSDLVSFSMGVDVESKSKSSSAQDQDLLYSGSWQKESRTCAYLEFIIQYLRSHQARVPCCRKTVTVDMGSDIRAACTLKCHEATFMLVRLGLGSEARLLEHVTNKLTVTAYAVSYSKLLHRLTRSTFSEETVFTGTI